MQHLGLTVCGDAAALQVVTILLTELAVLPIMHGYFLHICAWPLMPGQPQLSFGLSFILLHWLLGMVRSRPPYCACEMVTALHRTASALSVLQRCRMCCCRAS